MKNQKGFSLIELLIVVVIIGIIAAIAIPNLLASRRAANEASAISSLRTYHGAQLTYQATIGAGSFAGVPFTLNAFNVLADNNILDSSFSTGIKSGYTYAGHALPASGSSAACHLAQAYPLSYTGISATGSRHFVIATPGVVYSAAATGAQGWGPGSCEVAAGWNPLSN